MSLGENLAMWSYTAKNIYNCTLRIKKSEASLINYAITTFYIQTDDSIDILVAVPLKDVRSNTLSHKFFTIKFQCIHFS